MSLLRPDRYLASVTDLDLRELWSSGVRAILLDRDNTLVPRDTHRAPAEVVAWLAHARDLGFALCLVSNNWARNVRPDAEAFGATLVSNALKPFPFAIWHALRKVGVARAEAVFVGDQVFTDVLGANLAGVASVLVRPQTKKDLAHTLVLRRIEALVLRGVPLETSPADEPGPGARDGASAGATGDVLAREASTAACAGAAARQDDAALDSARR